MEAALEEAGRDKIGGAKVSVKYERLWHGTGDADTALKICNSGFDRMFSHQGACACAFLGLNHPTHFVWVQVSICTARGALGGFDLIRILTDLCSGVILHVILHTVIIMVARPGASLLLLQDWARS